MKERYFMMRQQRVLHSCVFSLAPSPLLIALQALSLCHSVCAFFSCVPISWHPDLSLSGPLLATCWWMTLSQLQTSQNSLELCSLPSQKFWFPFIGKLQDDKKYYEFNTFKQTCILFTTIASTNFQKIIVHRCAKHTRCSGCTGIMGLRVILQPQSI